MCFMNSITELDRKLVLFLAAAGDYKHMLVNKYCQVSVANCNTGKLHILLASNYLCTLPNTCQLKNAQVSKTRVESFIYEIKEPEQKITRTVRSKRTHKGACDQIKSYGEQWNSESADKTYEVIYTTEMENS